MKVLLVNEFLDVAGDYDGFVFGTPVHWGGATGAITSFLDRAFYADFCGGGDVGLAARVSLPEQEAISFTNFIR